MSAALLHREDAAWLAGLLDADGCLDAPRGNPRIRLKMADHDVILRAADIMAATTHAAIDYRENRKPLLVAQVTGDAAVAVMRAVLPWLSARRTARATEIILAHAAKGSRRLRALPPLLEQVAA